jgi:hypothetical protein
MKNPSELRLNELNKRKITFKDALIAIFIAGLFIVFSLFFLHTKFIYLFL